MQILQPNGHELDCSRPCLPIASWRRGCDYMDSVQGHSICFRLLTSHRRQMASRQWGWGSATPPSGEKIPEFPSLSRVTLWNKGLDFKTLACAVVVMFTKHLLCSLIVSVPVNMVPLNRGWRYSPLWTHCFKAFPGVAQKCSGGIPRFGSKSTEVRTQPFPAVCELVIFFLCWWGQLLSCSSAVKLSKTLKSLLLLITVSAVLHTLIISLWHRQWPFLSFSFSLALSGKNRKYEYVCISSFFKI